MGMGHVMRKQENKPKKRAGIAHFNTQHALTTGKNLLPDCY